MKYFQAMKKMDKDFPYLKLGDEFFVLFSCIDGLAKVALVCQLHHDAKTLDVLVEEGFIIFGDVGGTQRS